MHVARDLAGVHNGIEALGSEKVLYRRQTQELGLA